VPGTHTDTTGAGWTIATGEFTYAHYYLAEWRNFDGFDKGLKYGYDTVYSSNGPWKVDKIAYNAPGMLLWYRDTTYGNDNHVVAHTFDLPSTGSKGGLLIVDSHFDPLRRQGEAAEKDSSLLNNLPSRPQSSNAAFGLQGTYPFKECLGEVEGEDPFDYWCTSFGSRPGKTHFTDAHGWYPGLEYRPDLDDPNDPDDGPLFFRDIDASVVIPSEDNKPYSTRIVNENGITLNDLFGVDLGSNIVLGNGNPRAGLLPGDDESVHLGVKLTVQKAGPKNYWGEIWVNPADAADE
jgi:immune inhibitor A